MSEHAVPAFDSEPDADLVEYVVVTMPDVGQLDAVVPTVVHLVETGAISLIDVVLLARTRNEVTVTTSCAGEHSKLRALVDVADQRLVLSEHDVALAAATLEPAEAALVLLVEDRWATRLASASRLAGGRLSGGERIIRERVLAALARGREPATDAALEPARSAGAGNLLSRAPQPQAVSRLVVDSAAQVSRMATLLEQGVLTHDQYETQRRRAIHD